MEENSKNRLSAHSCLWKEGKLYFSALNINGIYEFTLANKELKFLGTITGERPRSKHLYTGVLEKNNRLYFAPATAKKIAVYDLGTKKIKTIEIKLKDYCVGNVHSKFWKILEKDFYIYFIPCRYRAVVRLDVRTDEILYIDGWCKKYFADVPLNEMIGKSGAYIRENKLIIATLIQNMVISIDLDNFSSECIRIGSAKKGFMDSLCDGKYIWLLEQHEARIWKYDRKTKEVHCFSLPNTNCHQEKYPYINLIDAGEKILVIAYHEKHSVMIEKSEGHTEFINLETQGSIGGWGVEHYFAKLIDSNQALIGNGPDHSMALFDLNTKKLSRWVMEDENLEEHIYQDLLLANVMPGEILVEQRKKDLENYLHELLSPFLPEEPITGKTCGEEIHKLAMRIQK